MATLKKYDFAGNPVGEVAVQESLLEKKANTQMIKDYLVAIRTNARQWSAHTKTRAEVNHSGQKPHPQKGTGRARQGYLGSPQYKGGGRVGGPRAKFDQHVQINKKEKRAAIRHLLAEKIVSESVIVLTKAELEKPKTKRVVEFLEKVSLSGKRVLFLGEGSSAPASFIQSMRNIARTSYLPMPQASGYDIALAQGVVVFEPAMQQLIEMLEG